MLVPQQVVDDVDDVVTDDVVDVVAEDDVEPTPSLPTPTSTPPPPQELPSTSQVAPTPPPSPIVQPSSPLPQQQPSQPSHTTTISMELLNNLLETWGIISLIDADKDVTLEEVDAAKDKDAKVAEDADVQGRLEESQAQVYHIDLEHADKVLSM
nr:hypothetical protein [Tanacetum cinerariifolium]